MNNRLIRRLSVASAVAVTALSGLVAPLAHADTLPGNTPSVPFPAATYSNGCSFPGPNLLFDTSPPLVDPSPWAWPYVFVVNFRPACDMHDAGYSGGIVFDPVNGGIVDTRGLSRVMIDNRFYNDLITLCNRQIGGNAFVARSLCYSIAATYYGAVRAAGWALFDASPGVAGLQSFGPRPNN
jgi:Prokaryotic phospholipase A2